jgi:hypothetical protein
MFHITLFKEVLKKSAKIRTLAESLPADTNPCTPYQFLGTAQPASIYRKVCVCVRITEKL